MSHKLNLTMDCEMRAAFDELGEACASNNDAETIRLAINLLEWAYAEARLGRIIMSATVDGRGVLEAVLPFSPKRPA